MSLIAARTLGSRVEISSLVFSFVEQRTSPARMMRFVVTMVSQATRASGSAPRNASTTVSDMRSATLSGWPSDTLSLVKTYDDRTNVQLPATVNQKTGSHMESAPALQRLASTTSATRR